EGRGGAGAETPDHRQAGGGPRRHHVRAGRRGCGTHDRGTAMSGSGRLAPDAIEARARRLNCFGFAFGSRFFVLLGVGLLALGPALFEPRLAYLVGAWDAAVLMVW